VVGLLLPKLVIIILLQILVGVCLTKNAAETCCAAFATASNYS
jgi:hypothetical protein